MSLPEEQDQLPFEEDLRERAERLTRAEESAGIGIWEIDVDSDTVRGSPQFFRIMGLVPTGDPVPMRVLRGLRFLEDRERVNQGYADAVVSGADIYESEYRIRRPDGQVRWILGRGRVVRKIDGHPFRYSGADLDITERKAIEQALADSETRLRLAIEAADLGIWDWNVITNEMTWSDTAKKIAGFSLDQPVTFEQVRSVTHPDDLPRTHEMAQRSLDPATRSREPYEYRIIRPDGAIRWVVAYGEAQFAKFGNGEKAVRYTGTIHDISAQKAVEEHRALLLNELQHRVKNTLALVNAMASQTFRASGDEAAVVAFSNRLSALGQAHTILTRDDWKGAAFTNVVQAAMAPHHAGDGRIDISGPEMQLTARQALSLSLALNELATNAIKYGALSVPGGRVAIRWSTEKREGVEQLQFRWEESGGPTPAPPERTGFGMRLIRGSLASDFGGEVALSYPPTGLVCVLDAPLKTAEPAEFAE